MPPQEPSASCRSRIQRAARRTAPRRAAGPTGCRAYAVQHLVQHAGRRRSQAGRPARLRPAAGRRRRSSSMPNGSGRTGRRRRHDRRAARSSAGPSRPSRRCSAGPTAAGSTISGGIVGQVVPGPQPEQRQPDPGEDPGGRDATRGPDEPGRGRAMCGASAGSPASRSATHASTVVDRSPGPPSKVAQVPSARCWERIQRARPAVSSGVEDAEELPQQQVLGVHGHVGLEVALPPAGRVLQPGQVRDGRRHRLVDRPPRPARDPRPECRRRAGAVGLPGAPPASSRSRRPPQQRAGQRDQLSAAAAGSTGASASARSASATWRRASAAAQARPPASSTRSAIARSSARSSTIVRRAAAPAWPASRRSRPAAGPPVASAATTGSDFLLARRSASAGLPVTAGSPQMPSRSSSSWKASPSSCAVRLQRGDRVRPARRPARRRRAALQASSAPVLPRGHVQALGRRSPTSRRSNARSSTWPPISALVVRPSRRPRPRRSASAGSSSTSRASDEQRVAGQDRGRHAEDRPDRARGAGAAGRRPSRRRAGARSCARSSTATAPGSPTSAGAPAARADSSASAGPHALAAAGDVGAARPAGGVAPSRSGTPRSPRCSAQAGRPPPAARDRRSPARPRPVTVATGPARDGRAAPSSTSAAA